MPGFLTTRWTLIARAQGDSEAAREALGQLFRVYWPPIYAYVRWTHDAEAARDITQDFFEVLLKRGLLRRVDRSLGLFRSFLLVALRNFLADKREHAAAQKRGGGAVLLSLDTTSAEDAYAAAVAPGETPERTYERAWAQTVVARAMERLRKEQASTGRSKRFEVLQEVLADTTLDRYADIGARLGMTKGAVAVAVFRLRKRLGELLGEEVAETVLTEAEIAVEVSELLRMLER